MIRYLLLITLLISSCYIATAKTTPTTNDPEIKQLLNTLSIEIRTVQTVFMPRKLKLYNRLKLINDSLLTETEPEKQLALLLAKNRLQNNLKKTIALESANIQKIRYLKGLSIIKILYEKTLSLDHHFASVATFNEINKMANPNNYQEFSQVQSIIKNKTDKKKTFNLGNILGQNIYTSAINTFLNLFNSNANQQEKETELKKIECILDFTLRMNTDLNTIFFETAYLQKSNHKIMEDLQRLFKDYTKPIKYHTPLKECRENDDWDIVKENLNTFLEKLEQAVNDGNEAKILKMQIDLNFPIDRIVQFINQYNDFINQGTGFYQKFKIILNSYENEQQCSANLPAPYKKLKSDIDIAIEKFNTAYKPVEINGSKLKELLYGVNEYD